MSMDDIPLKERLPRIGIFASALTESGAVDLIIPLLRPCRFAAGTVIIREGEEGDELFVLHHGRVRIEKRTPGGEMYTVVILDAAGNAVFGEAGLLDAERRSASVLAETDVECFKMSRKDFIGLGDTHPRLGLLITREISKVMSSRLKKANEDMVILFTALVSEIEGDAPQAGAH